jgi:hypothetical protein
MIDLDYIRINMPYPFPKNERCSPSLNCSAQAYV